MTLDAGDADPVCAVYKPARGERSLWDFPDGLYRREVAAYELSEALGWGLVPPTVVRDDGPFGPGSLQLFVEADYEQHYFTLLDDGGHDEDVLRAICAFDIVANNADRKSGHVLRGPDGRLWAIDHGLCFHRQPKLRTVIWDFADEAVPGEPILADLGGWPRRSSRPMSARSSPHAERRGDRRPGRSAWSMSGSSPSPTGTGLPTPGRWSEPGAGPGVAVPPSRSTAEDRCGAASAWRR